MRLEVWILSVLAGLGSGESVSSLWSGWAMVTPVLGDLSPGCALASQDYINNLSGAFQAILANTDLNTSQKNALTMFDANGAIPFFQEGMYQDATVFDICFFMPNSMSECESLPASLR